MLKLNLGTQSWTKPYYETGKTLTPTHDPLGWRRPARDTGTAQLHKILATLPLKADAPLNQEMK